MNNFSFSVRTRGGASPDNKPKVFFTCHPDDFDSCFESLCEAIFGAHDCAIYYNNELSSDDYDENLIIDLERMNLFVVPVTLKLLTTENRTMSFDIKFAKEKKLPILPLIMEPGIRQYYSKPEAFGEMQSLSPNCSDDTAIDFKDKLKVFLESVLFSDELAQTIRDSFDAYIFLSYRKKDRKYANDLMKLIHKNPECEDIAIWFDEFLKPGESYKTNINNYLSNSKVFTLLVTPNLLERQPDGTPNFVMREEYPAALRLNKRIFPVEMKKTDKAELQRDYAGIPECCCVDDEKYFNKRLLEILSGVYIPANNDNPEHNYLIGLAYLKGIDVEIDIDRGISLITKAANTGHLKAIENLYIMYREGLNVKASPEEALYWIKKHYDIMLKTKGEYDPKTMESLRNLANSYGRAGDNKKRVELLELCYDLRRAVLGDKHVETLNSLTELADGYRTNGDIKRSFEINKRCYELKASLFGEDNPSTLYTLSHLAGDYGLNGDHKKCLELHQKCYDTTLRIYGEENERTLSCLNNIASEYGKVGDIKKCIEVYQKCYALRKKVYGLDNTMTLLTLNRLGLLFEKVGYDKGALQAYSICYERFMKIAGDKNPDTLSSLFNLSSILLKHGNQSQGIELAKKCYEGNLEVYGEYNRETADIIGLLAKGYKDIKDYDRSIEYLEKQLKILSKISGPANMNTLAIFGRMCMVYSISNNLPKLLETHIRCYEVCCKELGEDSYRAKKELEDINNVKKRMGLP